MELHEYTPVGNGKDLNLLGTSCLIQEMLFDQHQQEFAASVVDVLPAFPLLAFVLANPLSFLISHLLPSSKRTTFENTSSFLSNEIGELDR